MQQASTKTKSKRKSEPKKVHLTNKLIQDLLLYYGLAIRRHTNSIQNMKKEIWATFFHKISTDEEPQHSHCPANADSWCKWRQHEAAGTVCDFTHPLSLHDDVQKVLERIYEELTANELLEWCLGNNTQNSNESFNACVWHLVPKHIFTGRKILQISAYTSACVFNEGFCTLLRIMEVMEITIRPAAVQLAHKQDGQRIAQANHRSTDASKKSKIARREERALENEAYEEYEGILLF
ncbi:uncharacterized protein LOC116853322 [Odontomachus brunneus]|uniref:uncharacterized protein LOC116853322 n=1 Tax=Odontomachus brunneus TaxID=486640 RepID=UPI0013F1A728|nr:uncharacterized protein LOC116853322 [Odontomachus brunneus]